MNTLLSLFFFQSLWCKPVASLDHFTPEMLGTAELVEEVQTGDSKLVKVSQKNYKDTSINKIITEHSGKIAIPKQESLVLRKWTLLDSKRNGLFTLLDSDSDCKPNGYIELCRTFHTAELDSDSSPNCRVQELDWESGSVNVNKPQWSFTKILSSQTQTRITGSRCQ